MKQRKMKPRRRRVGERVLRRASTIRRSQRSVGRSGYAFSHQEGFGELITSGSLMIRKHPRRPAAGNVVQAPPAAVDNVVVTSLPFPDRLDDDDSGVPSAAEGSTLDSSDIATEGVPLTPVEEETSTSFADLNVKPRNPVVV